MTARRDQDIYDLAESLGYEDQGVRGSHRLFVHKDTGARVTLPASGSDWRDKENCRRDLRLGAGVSNRGRAAVVNTRKARKPKKGANRERLEAEKRERDYLRLVELAEAAGRDYEIEQQRERKIAREQAQLRNAVRPQVVERMRELTFYDRLMRGA